MLLPKLPHRQRGPLVSSVLALGSPLTASRGLPLPLASISYWAFYGQGFCCLVIENHTGLHAGIATCPA